MRMKKKEVFASIIAALTDMFDFILTVISDGFKYLFKVVYHINEYGRIVLFKDKIAKIY